MERKGKREFEGAGDHGGLLPILGPLLQQNLSVAIKFLQPCVVTGFPVSRLGPMPRARHSLRARSGRALAAGRACDSSLAHATKPLSSMSRHSFPVLRQGS